MCRIWLNRNLIRCTIWLCYSGDMFTSAGMSQWPSMFTRPSGELHESGRNCLAWLPLCCWLYCCWACSNGGCCSWGNCSFQMVCGLFCHRFAAALLFSHSLSLSYAWLRALLWNMRSEREREGKVALHMNSKQPIAAPYPFICTLVCSLSSLKLILSGLW